MIGLIVSIALFCWLVFDLFSGKVWSYYEISRDQEPAKYWLWMVIWFVVATMSLMSSYYWW